MKERISTAYVRRGIRVCYVNLTSMNALITPVITVEPVLIKSLIMNVNVPSTPQDLTVNTSTLTQVGDDLMLPVIAN